MKRNFFTFTLAALTMHWAGNVALDRLTGISLYGENNAVAAEGFYQYFPYSPEPKLPDQPANLAQLTKATKKTSECTAFFTSNDGYAITAFECVARCLYEAGMLKLVDFNGTIYGIRTTKNPTVKCDEAYVNWTGKIAQMSNTYLINRPSIPKKQLTEEELIESTQNFAVVKYDGNNEYSCLKANLSKKPLRGERLYAIGYPYRARRLNLMHSHGPTYPHISYGKYVEKIANAKFPYPELFPAELTPPRDDPNYETYYSFYDSNYLISDVDTAKGYAGGPLLNRNGEIVGVNMFSNEIHIADDEIKANLYSSHLSILEVADSIKRRFGSQYMNQVFNCNPLK